MSVQIQVRRGTSAEWSSANPILAQGEQGYDVTVKQIKMGDGTTAWNDLSFPAADLVTPSSVIASSVAMALALG